MLNILLTCSIESPVSTQITSQWSWYGSLKGLHPPMIENFQARDFENFFMNSSLNCHQQSPKTLGTEKTIHFYLLVSILHHRRRY